MLPEAPSQDLPGTPAGLPIAGHGVAQASLTSSPGAAAIPLGLDARDGVNADRTGTFSGGEMAELRRLSPAGEPGGSAAAVPGVTGVRPNPFADIPSLYDLYRQVPVRTAPLQRFGLEIFHHGTRDPQQLPMDLPVGPDYIVGPGDALAVDVWGSVSQRLQRVVDRDGRLALPEVGPMLVSGRSLGEVQTAVERVLRTQFRDVSADVSLMRLRTIRVYVVGDVQEPGAYDIGSLSTPLNAFFVAGGPTAAGSLRTLRHYRGDVLVQELDVYDLLLRGTRSDLLRLENGDTVLVPPMGPQVTVDGAVRRPAIYELRGEQTLGGAIAMAGGVLPTAALQRIELQRVEAHRKRTMFSIDLSGAESPEALAAQLDAFQLRDGDEVHIVPIAPATRDAIYLAGHVLRPGRVSYRDGMRVADVVASYADLLPEPAVGYAEIVRLNEPDFRPSVESFDLGAALERPDASPVLQPLDTIRIFSRYDFEEPPHVWVGGEVRSPGSFRSAGQLRVRDALHLAGGLTPDARLDLAQVIRQLPDSTVRVMSIDLDAALAGNPLENLVLEPRDRLLVHANPARVDPATVSLRGQVSNPGRFALATGMRISDLMRMGGGMTRSAFLERADLTRFLSADGREQATESREIDIAAALAGDPGHDLLLRDGDTLAIRQIPGWKDVGASVTLAGEVAHPGTYGIQPGERLSSVLRRAGGFLPTAYPQGAVLLREEVREVQERSRQELIYRLEADASNVHVSLDASARDQAELQQAAIAQRQRVLQSLRQTPVSGRMVITLSTSLGGLEGSSHDIELRDGDQLVIPKPRDFVVITGQVYSSNAVTFSPRRNVRWYLEQAGGATDLADTKAVFVVRANGSVVGGGNALSTRIERGDMIVVPEKPLGQSTFWKNFLSVAQVTTQVALGAAILTR
jgi:polysaccharide biosynthesis/export protein